MKECGWVMLPQVPKVLQPLPNLPAPWKPPTDAQESSSVSQGSFAIGECVDYWSQRHAQWIMGKVLKRHVDPDGNIIGYDLDVKQGAETSKIRKRPADTTNMRGGSDDLCATVTRALSEGWLTVADLQVAV